MMTHPGKKLLFMGQDLGEFDEWNEKRIVQWNLTDVPEHEGISLLVKDLNGLYRTNRALYSLDSKAEGFEWLNNISGNECYLSYVRKSDNPEETLVVVANFAGVGQEITTGVPYEGKYKEIFNTDNIKYGGTGIVNDRAKRATDKRWDERAQSITVRLAPLSLSVLQFIPYTEEELTKVIEERIRKNTPIKQSTQKNIKKTAQKEAAPKASAKKPKSKKES
jgi:1,4-alpha-glucan branching enzyme